MDALLTFLGTLLLFLVVLALLWSFGADILAATVLEYTVLPLVRWFLRVFYGIDKPLVGPEALVGSNGHAISDFTFTRLSRTFRGRVKIGAEVWNARSTLPITSGNAVRVVECRGLALYVEPGN
jgi:membrane protein implicated in regulation of membrane protease activity